MNEDGYIWIVDRVAAGFVTDGGVVYPGDVERALMEHPLVADAGVVGIADDDGPRVGLAFVVVAPGGSVSDDDLLVHVRGRLPSYAIPATFRYLDELPRNSVGKLRRDELRRRA